MIERLQNWVETRQVIDPKSVRVPSFETPHPKEPAAAWRQGTFYVACAVWDKAARPRNKEVVLCRADRYDGPFTQVCQVTQSEEPGVYNHAPAVLIENGEIWVFYAHKRPFTKHRQVRRNSIRARHASLDAIPSSPEGWKEEGTLIDGARDPGLFKSPDGVYHLFATGERGESAIVRFQSPDLLRWSGPSIAWKVFHGKGDTAGEAPDIVPKRDGDGYWLIVAAQSHPRLSIAGESRSLVEPFSGCYIVGYHNSLNGIQNPFYACKTQHHDYLFRAGGDDIHKVGGRIVSYFEGFDGAYWSVGVCCAEESNSA